MLTENLECLIDFVNINIYNINLTTSNIKVLNNIIYYI